MTREERSNLSIKIGELEIQLVDCRAIKIKPDLSNIRYLISNGTVEQVSAEFEFINSSLRETYDMLEDKKASEIKQLEDALENETTDIVNDLLQGRTFEEAKVDIITSYDKKSTDIKPVIAKLDNIKDIIEDIKNPNRVKGNTFRKFI